MGYSKIQTKAWAHLNEVEKSTLSLVVVHNRTRQEASLILNIAPYKFSEIYLRARRLFILFTEYYDNHKTLIPDPLILEGHEELFLKALLVYRMPASKAVLQYPTLVPFMKTRARTQFWDSLFEFLDSDEGLGDFKNLLIEFDKWSPSRILPKAYRQTSPFTRRRVREFKKVYKSLIEVTDTGWQLLEDIYGTENPPLGYIPSFELGGFGALSVQFTPQKVTYYNRNRLPIFLDKVKAQEMAEITYDYNNLKKQTPLMAQKFWASFREILSKAYNYNELLGIQPGDMFELQDRDKKFISKSLEKTKPKTARVRPTKDGEFWV